MVLICHLFGHILRFETPQLYRLQHGENRADIHTLATGSRVENIWSVYGSSVARELIPIEASDDDPARSRFKMDGYISSANYSAKKTIMVLFINSKVVCLVYEDTNLSGKKVDYIGSWRANRLSRKPIENGTISVFKRNDSDIVPQLVARSQSVIPGEGTQSVGVVLQ